jgi:murein DD-endopeptidase MepM/ murein hydrolase activator NlpD
VDIQADLAAVASRIAQITGAPSVPDFNVPAGAAPQNASFAGALAGAMMPQTPSVTGAFAWPVDGTVTSGFGERANPMGAGTDFHPGIDIAADEGTPIRASAGGRVVSAGPDGGYGNLVVVDNGNGVTTRYGHCSQIFARVGQSVDAGSIIAAVGSTGHSTGPHLHFEVRVNDKPVDPAGVLSPR